MSKPIHPAKINKQEALEYHSTGKPGKIEVIPTKAYSTQRDLSLAYSPGVAEPCLEIKIRLEVSIQNASLQILPASFGLVSMDMALIASIRRIIYLRITGTIQMTHTASPMIPSRLY